MTRSRLRLRVFVSGGLAVAAAAAPLPAQDVISADSSAAWAFANSKAENYLRYAQTLGEIPAYPWSLRGFAAGEVAAMRSGPCRAAAGRCVAGRGQRGWRWIPTHLTAWYNSTFPFGSNDGAVWAGRGLTASASGGGVLTYGPVELVLAPLLFWTENRTFPLMATPESVSVYADPVNSTGIDLPQRFGDRSYGGLDLGASTLRVSGLGFTAGVSTAAQWWGPMSDYPFVLGTNAAGFPHVFLGTSRPTSTGLGRIHARLMYGQVDQSAFSPVSPDSARRFVGGVIATFEPRGIPGLEVGVSRFYHLHWPDRLRAAYFTHAFESLLKGRIGRILDRDPNDQGLSSADNQLASFFGRWVHARSGIEVYGEYGREDHSVDTYDLLLEPDHSAVYGVGFRKAWRRGQQLHGLRAEQMNFLPSTLGRHRAESGAYPHVYLRQGHTHQGQLLGTPVAGAAVAAIVALTTYDAAQTAEYSLARLLTRDGDHRMPQVQYVARLERTRAIGRALEIRLAVDAVLEMNRYFRGDQGNARLEVGTRWLH